MTSLKKKNATGVGVNMRRDVKDKVCVNSDVQLTRQKNIYLVTPESVRTAKQLPDQGRQTNCTSSHC